MEDLLVEAQEDISKNNYQARCARMKNRKIVLFFTVLLVLLSTLTGCSSEDDSSESSLMIPVVKQDTYVYDQGNFLDDSVESQVNSLLVELEKQTTIEFAVITIPSLNDLTIEQYAVKLGNNLGIGKAEDDNGILLLISKEDTAVRLEIGKGLQGILTDATSGRILDQFFVPNRDENNYDDACSQTVQAVINYLASSEEYEISISGLDKEIVLEEIPFHVYVIGFILLLIFLIIVEFITGYVFGDGFGDGLVFLILECMADSGGSGSRGGFGGGSFNGGGASR